MLIVSSAGAFSYWLMEKGRRAGVEVARSAKSVGFQVGSCDWLAD